MKALVNSLAIRIWMLIFAVGMLALVVVSPIALQQIARIHGLNWMRLSNIGQTYGAVSALVTALALGGVIISLLYQARDVKTTREQTSRAFHNELLKIEMESPFYMDVLAAPSMPSLADYDSLRRNHLVHMWVSFWEGQYMLREISESTLRYLAVAELFASAAGRQYWRRTRNAKLENYEGRHLRFTKIIDEEYSKALASGPPVASSLKTTSSSGSTTVSRGISHIEPGIGICAAVVAAILAGRLLSRRFSRRP